ncbi:hypothetical protein [Saccharothrix xinjiangensis]|uniref:Dolichyl-phosphate-mannose-protein mannosyltransferase n=1 Tax=Saccharothrix xinjiangensis TaxID=204798 RepID=A0ABV9XVS6_9PSEU
MTHLATAPGRDPGATADPGGAEVDPPRSALVARTTSWPVVIAAAATGTLVVGLSYRLSAAGDSPSRYYATFWAGVLLALVPLTVRIATGDRGRAAWGVALLGVLTYVPKLLRNPAAPAYHDEYAHWREAVDVLSSGSLLPPNAVIPIVQFYPGTSGLTAVVQRLTGLPVWTSGQLVVFTAHVLALFAVFVIAQVHLRSPTAGALGAVIYALNPSKMYFDSQYAYEGLAVALFLWALALAGLAARAHGRPRTAATAAAVLCGAGCVVTHHLSTLFLLLLLFLVAIATSIRARTAGRRRDTRPPDEGEARTWWIVFGSTAVTTAAWLGLVARPTLTYLSPYFGGAVGELSGVLKRQGTGRAVLTATAQPLWERGATALAPVVVGLGCLTALLVLRRAHRAWRADTLALMAFGLLYLPSVLFLLTPSGAEGTRRSWAFTYVGIALIGAFLVVHARGRIPVWRSPPVLLLLFAVVLIGNVGAGLNDQYRFPKPFTWGSDTNSASAEARTVAEQLAAAAGDVRVVTDRFTGLQVAAYGGLDLAAPSVGFPAWGLTQTPGDPDVPLVQSLVTSRFDYLVVDIRMAHEPAYNGNNYGPEDPLAGRVTPIERLDRLDRVPWASRIITTEHLRVYRLDLGRLGAPVASGP